MDAQLLSTPDPGMESAAGSSGTPTPVQQNQQSTSAASENDKEKVQLLALEEADTEEKSYSVQDSVYGEAQSPYENVTTETVTERSDQKPTEVSPHNFSSIPSTETPDEKKSPTLQPSSAGQPQISQSALNPQPPTYSKSALNPQQGCNRSHVPGHTSSKAAQGQPHRRHMGRHIQTSLTYSGYPDNYLPLAIFVTFCCCPLLGVLAILSAITVKPLYEMGNYEGAKQASVCARRFSLASIFAAIVIIILLIIVHLWTFNED